MKVGVALQKVTSTESIVLLGDFNTHMNSDNKTWKSVIGRQGDSNTNRNGRCLLQFCATNGLCIMNTFFHHKRFISTPGCYIYLNRCYIYLNCNCIYLNQQSFHVQLLVVVANMWEVKWVVRKELLGGTKKLKKLFMQRKLRLELG